MLLVDGVQVMSETIGMASQEYILEVKDVSKSFPGVKALQDVSFFLRKGSVHALLGENGAGKSTLVNILSGLYKPDKGNIFIEGKEVHFENTIQSQRCGISVIHQELNLCWNLTVAENIFLNREITGPLGFCRIQDMNEAARNLLEKVGAGHIVPSQKVGELSVASQQMVEIAKAVSVNAKIIIMDEPTSSITDKEVALLFQIIKNLQRNGVSIIYISHKIDEIFNICDEVTVLRDGVLVDTMPIEDVTIDKIIELMVGRPLDRIYPSAEYKMSEKTIFEVKSLYKEGFVNDVSFEIKKGEILGVFGLVGSGRTEMAKVLFGRFSKDKGKIFLDGEEIGINNPNDAIKHGIALVTEDRKKEGLILILSVKDNIMSSNLDLVIKLLGFIDRRKEREIASQGVQKLQIKTPSIDFIVKFLSGGNQQKVILSRWLSRNIKVLILDEPTRGIDVGAKAEIYEIMRMLCKNGVAILMISSELPEILGMSDRIAVMHNNKIVKIFNKQEATQEKIMYYATGGK